MIKISNSFSIQMLTGNSKVRFRQMTKEYVSHKLSCGNFESYIGHKDLAAVITDAIGGIEIPTNRASLKLNEEDILIVAQYRGPRLPEGTTQLPPDATIEFWKVVLI